jgi:hypothetical protein
MDRDARNWYARVARMRVPLGGSTMSLQRERALILTVLLILTAASWAILTYAPRRRRPPGSKITQLVLFEVPVQEKAAGAETASPYSSTPSDFISLILVLSLLNCLVPVRVPHPISSPPAPPLLDAVPIPSGSCVGRFHIAPLLAAHATKRWSRPQHSQS